jgi:DNA-directed RNA polymerase specialized sigma24 family protein
MPGLAFREVWICRVREAELPGDSTEYSMHPETSGHNEALNGRKALREEALRDFGVEPRRSQPEVLEAVAALPVQQRAAIYLSYWGVVMDD